MILCLLCIYILMSFFNERNLETQVNDRVNTLEALCEIYNRTSLEMKGVKMLCGKYGAYLRLKKVPRKSKPQKINF